MKDILQNGDIGFFEIDGEKVLAVYLVNTFVTLNYGGIMLHDNFDNVVLTKVARLKEDEAGVRVSLNWILGGCTLGNLAHEIIWEAK